MFITWATGPLLTYQCDFFYVTKIKLRSSNFEHCFSHSAFLLLFLDSAKHFNPITFCRFSRFWLEPKKEVDCFVRQKYLKLLLLLLLLLSSLSLAVAMLVLGSRIF